VAKVLKISFGGILAEAQNARFST